ncbi:hypothetical protein EV361DRAFT_866331 [Lentinula raphanica]|nr:hypothetical protein EV361DRAFT_866331 [Lentinula raphanica]
MAVIGCIASALECIVGVEVEPQQLHIDRGLRKDRADEVVFQGGWKGSWTRRRSLQNEGLGMNKPAPGKLGDSDKESTKRRLLPDHTVFSRTSSQAGGADRQQGE